MYDAVRREKIHIGMNARKERESVSEKAVCSLKYCKKQG